MLSNTHVRTRARPPGNKWNKLLNGCMTDAALMIFKGCSGNVSAV